MPNNYMHMQAAATLPRATAAPPAALQPSPTAAAMARDPSKCHPVFFTSRAWRPMPGRPNAACQSPIAFGYAYQDSRRQGEAVAPRL
ncbi:hypothetical protein MAPG_05295 [Magnaporthiopsis poae ATCC 64411]|uniref:Uncharacterized protein n=1 Tax=Magnaporthiopsis poae (strain ATCC 64411 / 73-15) TaxID=644358 RepID=A0A0C4DZ08_MAGP6|nr:hypothetical protein MAPG_05295 [Magnaporthiopsis poae ATCC 64411]